MADARRILITPCAMLVIPRLAKRAEGPRNCNRRLLRARVPRLSYVRSLAVCAARDDTHLRVHLSPSAISDMQRAFLHGEGSFFHSFAQGWMRVNGATEIFRTTAKL